MTPSIRTPDERLRVFVSSTLQELANERGAARDAIEHLRLTPILFEAGARPYPPQDLYRAYLERSDIFVGIYGERYGWVGPGMEISGLEDEFLRSAEKPRLLYVKRPAREREPRLTAFLARLEDDATVSFKTFRDKNELRELVKNDLALLLSERFATGPGGQTLLSHSSLPAPVDEFVGRKTELTRLRELLVSGSRLLTVTGPGGVGKTRLAIEAARLSRERFPDGLHFVDLSAIREPELLALSILTALEVPPAPTSAGSDALLAYLREKRALLLLDNLEQLLDAASEIARLLAASPYLHVLVTSRSVLRLRGEREFALAPLEIPDAVRLFTERASAVAPSFQLTNANAEPVRKICHRLEGLPLAIELAAARVRALPAESLLPLLERRPEFLTGGRDYPERHQTLHALIDWSFALLERSDQDLLERWSVFRGGWNLAAATAVADAEDPVFTGLESLIEKSLVRQDALDGEPRFTMLEMIREYAARRLETRGHTLEAGRLHADFFLDLVIDAGNALRTGSQEHALDRLELESDNIRAALRWSLEQGDPDRVAAAGWELMPYWWLRGLFDEGMRWMSEAIDSGCLSREGRAEALLVTGFIAFWRSDYTTAVPALTEALGVFSSAEDRHRAALARLPLAAAQAARGDTSAIDALEESRAVLAEVEDEWGLMLALNGLCWASNMLQRDAPLESFEEACVRAAAVGTKAELATAVGNLSRRRALRGESEEARLLLAEVLETVRELRSSTGVAYYTEMAAELASTAGDHTASLRLFAAAQAIRADAKVELPLAVAAMHERALSAARSALSDEAIQAARDAGAQLATGAVAAEAIAWARRSPDLRAKSKNGAS